jgi:hypothetical protein
VLRAAVVDAVVVRVLELEEAADLSAARKIGELNEKESF